MSGNEKRQSLDQAVRQVRDRIVQSKQRAVAIGEQNTKAILIEPVLESLGWDLRDLEQVVREYRAQPNDNPVDYALLQMRSPLLFIEAKDLGSNLTGRRWVSQIMGYATVVGVEWCVLTDGDEYRIYNSHAPVDVEDKLFRVVSISDSDSHESTVDTLMLLSKETLSADDLKEMWDAYFTDYTVQQALDALFQDDSSGIVRLIRRRAPELTPRQIRKSLQRADIRVEFATTSEKPPPAQRPENVDTHQRTLVIASESWELRYARDIIVQAANWLVEQGKLRPENCPIGVTRQVSRGANRCLVNTTPMHLDGSDFRSPQGLSNGLFVETHASRRDIERYARRLLSWAGVEPDLLRVYWDDD